MASHLPLRLIVRIKLDGTCPFIGKSKVSTTAIRDSKDHKDRSDLAWSEPGTVTYMTSHTITTHWGGGCIYDAGQQGLEIFSGS